MADYIVYWYLVPVPGTAGTLGQDKNWYQCVPGTSTVIQNAYKLQLLYQVQGTWGTSSLQQALEPLIGTWYP